jgi:ariadne-1
LEKAVEDLSELLEQPIEPETIPSLRQKVTDKTVSLTFSYSPRQRSIVMQVYVQKRNEIVLEDTANGFIENRWKWNVPVEGFDDHVPIDP